MKYNQIGVGTKIELEPYDKNGDKTGPILVSQYEAYDEKNNRMEIHAPFYEGKMYAVHREMIMDVIFSKGNDTFSFTAEAIERFVQDRITLLVVKPLTGIVKIERRSFFRMECRLNVKYHIPDTLLPDGEEGSPDDLIQTVTRDISGGGICIVTDTELEKGALLEVFLELDRKVRFLGIVARSIGTRENGKQIYNTGIEFKRIENRDRERIISYVFETQRDRLKKGWMRYDGEF